jgi:hypothetical protein
MELMKYPHGEYVRHANAIGMDAEFMEWLEVNHAIWEEFCALAALAQSKGRIRWSARAIMHVLRWNRMLRDPTDPLFKINNNWSARMARLYNHFHGLEFFAERDGHA